ncbi:glycosyl transferase family 1 [Hanstruepera neustonica]|uniref:Glycosyl transferase family 1 n=1 Tax=Hanstruepera neustonica TaxID=1445657 RepID=A0A2K1E0B4_9FLAO|nr:glycosyltransferase [Hanstruepera neustonica]PNQ73730.1 glycosyl transferase family 1 [Hanstruepera neustonica]
MRILLIGEFSRLHNSLKEGLITLGHEVVIIGTGDQFKKYPVDIDIDSKLFNRQPFLFFRKLIHKLTKFDIAQIEIYFRIKSKLPILKGFDVVQLINEDAFFMHPKLQIPLLVYIFKQNKSAYLLSCGDDYISINHYLKSNLKYSILTPYKENPNLKSKFNYSLKYTTKPYKKLHDYLYQNTEGVIASDLDYHLPLKGNNHYLGLIPNPINTDKIEYIDLKPSYRIIVFLGINSPNYIKKGIQFFDEALEIISQKYGDKVTVIKTENLPYDEYIQSYNQAHIVLDQVYAYDQGYNALEAMAKGKVVFTGAEQEWLEYYNLEEDTVAINALPHSKYIADKLSMLIENPDKILEISKNARAFIEKEHNYINISQRYLDVWTAHS